MSILEASKISLFCPIEEKKCTEKYYVAQLPGSLGRVDQRLATWQELSKFKDHILPLAAFIL